MKVDVGPLIAGPRVRTEIERYLDRIRYSRYEHARFSVGAGGRLVLEVVVPDATNPGSRCTILNVGEADLFRGFHAQRGCVRKEELFLDDAVKALCLKFEQHEMYEFLLKDGKQLSPPHRPWGAVDETTT